MRAYVHSVLAAAAAIVGGLVGQADALARAVNRRLRFLGDTALAARKPGAKINGSRSRRAKYKPRLHSQKRREAPKFRQARAAKGNRWARKQAAKAR
jgi:hypothetical protein